MMIAYFDMNQVSQTMIIRSRICLLNCLDINNNINKNSLRYTTFNKNRTNYMKK